MGEHLVEEVHRGEAGHRRGAEVEDFRTARLVPDVVEHGLEERSVRQRQGLRITLHGGTAEQENPDGMGRLRCCEVDLSHAAGMGELGVEKGIDAGSVGAVPAAGAVGADIENDQRVTAEAPISTDGLGRCNGEERQRDGEDSEDPSQSATRHAPPGFSLSRATSRGRPAVIRRGPGVADVSKTVRHGTRIVSGNGAGTQKRTCPQSDTSFA